MRDKTSLKPPRHSRSHFDQDKLQYLAENIVAIGMLNPIEILPDGEIISGHRRWQASMLSNAISEVPVRVVTDRLEERDIRVRRISENLQRVDLSFWDKYLECKGFREEEPGISLKEIAALIHVDASTVTRYLCLDHCIEAVRQAAMDRRIGMKQCYDISKQPQEKQPEWLEKKLRANGQQKGKKNAGTVPAARLGKLKVDLPSGFQVVVICDGDTPTLEEAIAALAEALKLVRRGEKDGLDPQTFADMCRDKAAAGV